ncbi:tigger transposable element-derived protein 6-like [Stylophora pistillata]|uniref:Tigger transposable element-derived protein 6 n=1 Tax=Stylophora pistillata TaxID=50429 RepID=A0A2B4R4Z9_STYPI|nr:tigger transposable element-derived protein 6-like [Stylophora pistillata]PFX11437.1 Tigger transposable element-derived protein 6 [Stylophora pistillata]
MTLDERVRVIKLSNQGDSARKIAASLGFGKTQVQTVIRNKEEILKEWESGVSGKRKYSQVRKTQYDDLNSLIWEWFCTARAKGLPVSGTLLQSKALMFSLELNHDGFMASNGWLESFKARHNIRCAVLSGEAADVDPTVVDDWEKRLETILEGYALEDIYNADETGVFFRALPTKSLVLRGEQCSGGKKSKDRLTLLLACSATGRKLKPLVIGKSKKPRCFKGKDIGALNIIYRHNSKAWMTSQLFCEWLDIVNNQMRNSNRKIILIVDNCAAHPQVERSNIKLVFLPPNTTAKLQPCDAGIIQAVKLQYRKKLLRKIAFAFDEVESASSLAKKVTIFDAIMWLRHAWSLLPETTIQKCFAHCGIKAASVDEVAESEGDSQDIVTDEEILPLLDGVTLEEYDNPDNALLTSCDGVNDPNWETRLIEQAKNGFDSDADEDDEEQGSENSEEDQSPEITVKEAARMVVELKRFSFKNNLKPEIVDALLNIESAIEQVKFDKHAKQSKVTKFFLPLR